MGHILTFLTCWLAFAALATCEQQFHRRRTRVKRSNCDPKFTVIPGHTACLDPSPNVVQAGVTDAEMNTIVTDHNNYRSGVSPTATDMMRMSWDSEVATVAQRWAENCVIQHDGGYERSNPGRFSVGQNLAWASFPMGFSESIRLWYDEVSDFNPNGGNVLSQVGHYTQVVWAKSIKLGCGYAECSGTHYYVCNYAPGGNSDINRPYTFGTSCSGCPGRCTDNLCDCGGLVCENDSTMNINNCTCTCEPYSHFTGSQCALNCDNLGDPNHCTFSYQQSYCSRFTNVPSECPELCGTCDYTPLSVSTSTTPSTVTSVSSTVTSVSSTVTTVLPGDTTISVSDSTPASTVTTFAPGDTTISGGNKITSSVLLRPILLLLLLCAL